VTTAGDVSNYPRARDKRGSVEAAPGAPSVPLPRMRVLPFATAAIGSSRRSISLPRVQGPALIKDVQFMFGFGVDPPSCTFEIGVSLLPVFENAVANTVPRPYTVLTELSDPAAALLTTAGDGFPVWTIQNPAQGMTKPLDLILDTGAWYVVLAVCNPTAAAGACYGHVRVLEGIDPEALRFFL